MKKLLVLTGLLAFAVSASACWPRLTGVVSCPNGGSAEGISILVLGVGSSYNQGATDTIGNGSFAMDLNEPGTYKVCIDENTLPPGASVVGPKCVKITVGEDNWYANVEFTLTGPFCETPPPPGPCWLTGGGTISTGAKGAPHYSYGGVVNPGCSPIAAGGGNWNVVNHKENLHFKGLDIVVIECGGVPTKSPKVPVNIIDFVGTGTIAGINGNNKPLTPVTFVARAVDVAESGANKDLLYLEVKDAVTSETLLQIGTPEAPVAVSTGNLQIHTSSCP